MGIREAKAEAEEKQVKWSSTCLEDCVDSLLEGRLGELSQLQH